MPIKPKKPKKVKPKIEDDETRNSRWFAQIGEHVVNLGTPKGNIEAWVERKMRWWKKRHPDWDKP